MRDQRHPQHESPENPGEPYGNLNPVEDGPPRVRPIAAWVPVVNFVVPVLFVVLLAIWWWYESLVTRGIGHR